MAAGLVAPSSLVVHERGLAWVDRRHEQDDHVWWLADDAPDGPRLLAAGEHLATSLAVAGDRLVWGPSAPAGALAAGLRSVPITGGSVASHLAGEPVTHLLQAGADLVVGRGGRVARVPPSLESEQVLSRGGARPRAAGADTTLLCDGATLLALRGSERPRAVASGPGLTCASLVLLDPREGKRLWWVERPARLDRPDARLWRVALDGGEPEEVASGLPTPTIGVLDPRSDDAVWLALGGAEHPLANRVVRVRPGTRPEVVLDASGFTVRGLATRGDDLLYLGLRSDGVGGFVARV